MNKLAAGALALALGLGAVAPAVAAETKSNYTGAELSLEKYEKEVKKVNELRDDYLKEAEINALVTKNLKDAKAELKAAREAYQALFPAYVQVLDGETAIPVGDLVLRQVKKYQAELNNLVEKGTEVDYAGDLKKYQAEEAKNGRKAAEAKIKSEVAGWVKLAADKKITPEEFNAAIDRYVNAVAEYAESIKSGSKRDLAYKKVIAAERKFDVAKQEYNEKYSEKAEGKYNAAFGALEAAAKTYGFAVQVGNNGIKLVKDGEARIKAPGKKATRAELIKELKAEVDRNKAAVASAEFLLKYTPKTVAKVEGKLKAQIVEAKAAIEKAEKALEKVEKKAAFIATAYADDEEVSDEDLESLIKDNKESADNLENTMKENEKAQPEVEEEKKPEEKKPEEKTPSKKAGNNARTGIAGVAGVAGILAAASVAYAASKRD